MRIIISILLTMGLVACSDDAKQTEMTGENHPAAVEEVKVKPVPAAVQAPKAVDTVVESMPEAGNGKTIELNSHDVSTQAVKKDDIQTVGLQHQAAEKTQAVVEALIVEQKVKPTEAKPVKETLGSLKEDAVVQVEKTKKDIAQTAISGTVEAKKLDATEALKDKLVPEKKSVAAPLGDAVKGKSLAKRCLACHDFGMRDKAGPHLQGVFQRAAGQSGFKKHSKAFKSANWVWDETHLLTWVCDSKSAVKAFTSDPSARTKMPNQKMCGKKAEDIVAYLKTL